MCGPETGELAGDQYVTSIDGRLNCGAAAVAVPVAVVVVAAVVAAAAAVTGTVIMGVTDFVDCQWLVRRRPSPNARPDCGRCRRSLTSTRRACAVRPTSILTATTFETSSSTTSAWLPRREVGSTYLELILELSVRTFQLSSVKLEISFS